MGEESESMIPSESVAVLDFDMLCASVALQSLNRKEVEEEEAAEVGGSDFRGVQRMWEGEVLDCVDDRRISIQAACCPCYRFGRNMGRAGLGPCFLQGSIYSSFMVVVLFNFIAFGVTKKHCFFYMGLASIILFGSYMGYFRTRIRKQFNIRGTDSYVDDCAHHLICPCCTLCQESRTLEMNNVQDGVWRGRGDTICIGSYGEGNKEFTALHKPSLVATRSPELLSMERALNGSHHSWDVDAGHTKPLVLEQTTEQV
ncbi:protein PLANT CADMIUM RESISTANCE 5-like [Iris pallida]|uniref:Protein PLANT CADMIUM RESISTANCE 5-like n=1 Tax=Iris pallida TaxID=29817 RepID=A0AAX6HMW3_IRIPA|nr:protein PLANT CADMIUM RESISTANCE 5-like [Iris pallida]KAJ6842440.1 protein PLANT CADMIUM RESISTANCE 5-like [Iris pallida]